MTALTALSQHQGHQYIGIVSLPACQQILKPFVVTAVGYAVADHEDEGIFLQREAGLRGGGGGVLEPGRQGAAGDAADGALALDVGGGGAVLVEGRLVVGEIYGEKVDGGETALLVAADVQRGVDGR